MPRILLIAPPNLQFLQLKDNLIKKGFDITITTDEKDFDGLFRTFQFDCYILEPFSNFKMAARAIRTLNDLNRFPKILLLLPGLRPHEESTAKKIAKDNYFSINDSLEKITNKLNLICAQTSDKTSDYIKISSPIIHYIKSEIEKAKRSNSFLSFLYLQHKNSNPENKDIILTKINSIIHDRLRISDEAFPFKEGLLILLFGTSKSDCTKIKSVIFEKINTSLQKENLNFFSEFATTAATYPEDGNSYLEIIQFLEYPNFTNQNNIELPLRLSDMLNLPESFDKSFRHKQIASDSQILELKTYISINYMPPTWLGAFYQIENDEIQIYQCFYENEPLLLERILTISKELIKSYTQNLKKNRINTNPFQDIISIIGLEEFKNICIFCVLERSFKNNLSDCSELIKLSYLQISVALELSKTLDYPKKSELLLSLYCQNLGNILIKSKSPSLYQSIFDKNKTTNSSIGKLFFEKLGFTPSELTKGFLKIWNIEEHIAESAICARYEFTPKLNPQLTAVTHLAIVISNLISDYKRESNLKISKIAIDEIRLRNRTLKFESINYLCEEEKTWLNNYAFLKPSTLNLEKNT